MNKVAVLDLETDPFEYGILVKPFVAGFYDGSRCITIWDPDCVRRLVLELESEKEPLTIYAHNGGRFDFFYFMPYISSALRIINGRIVKAAMGKHELRDSYAIMPFPLADYDKDSIDYDLLRPATRERNPADYRDDIMGFRVARTLP